MSVISHHMMSLDGFIAGPDDSIDWSFAYGQPTSLAKETMHRIGAIVAGRRWYDLATERWNGVEGLYGGAYKGDVFVLTHRVPKQAPPRVHFVDDGIEAAVARTQLAAGGKDIAVFGGSLTQQCLTAGLLDEIILHIAPVLLGSGVRLFGDSDPRRIELQRTTVGEAEQLTDLRFRVVRA